MLASGSGSNLQALIDSPRIRPHLRLVVSDKPDAKALERARSAGIETRVIRFADYETRDSFSAAVADAVEDAGCGLMILAGFMRILSSETVDRFRGRILNIHPSLLPSFPGVHAVAKALEAGVKVTGVTVHVVDEGVDTGPIIAQRAVPVLPDDDEVTLHARIQVEEHALLPAVVAEVIAGAIQVGAP